MNRSRGVLERPAEQFGDRPRCIVSAGTCARAAHSPGRNYSPSRIHRRSAENTESGATMLTGATIAKPELAPPSVSVGSCGAGDWNELLRSSNADCVFLTREWIDTWCKHLADGRDLSLL